MYAVKLVFVLTLSVGYFLVDYASADVLKSVKQINEALKGRPGGDMTAEAFVVAAEELLEIESEGVNDGDTVSLLNKFIEVGTGVRERVCSGNFYQVYKSIPHKQAQGSWQVALELFKKEHDAICSKKLFPTLSHEKVNRVYEENIDWSRPVNVGVNFDMFQDRLVKKGLGQFSHDLARYFERLSEGYSLVDMYETYVTEPCEYYTKATSSIFEPQLHQHYVDGGEGFNFRFLAYQLCHLFKKEKTLILMEAVKA